jgi:hypothetical protein
MTYSLAAIHSGAARPYAAANPSANAPTTTSNSATAACAAGLSGPLRWAA